MFVDTYVSARAVTPQCTHACLQAALWRQEKFCDVKLRIGEEVFPAHRLVLAAQSQFLNALFDGGFKDSSAAIVELKEMEPSVFALVMDWMYDGSCALADASTLEHVLAAASLLQVDALVAAAATQMEKLLTPANCAGVLACADRHHLHQLRKKAEVVAAGAFVAVAGEACVPAASLRTLLARDDLIVEDERQIFETLSVWLKKQEPPLTQEAQIEMFSLVRFPLLPQNLLESSDVAENATLSTLAGRTMLLAQFQNAYFGAVPRTRGVLAQICKLLQGSHGKQATLELLYRASRDGWRAQDFHSRCDNKGATVTVIKCTGGFVFGGYADRPWNSIGNYTQSKAFLFSLVSPRGATPVKLPFVQGRNTGCHCAPSYGPSFGGGVSRVALGGGVSFGGRYDLCVADCANSTSTSYTHPGHAYQLPPGQGAQTFFTGAHHFQAAEVEVYQVQDHV